MKLKIKNKAWYFFFLVLLIYLILLITNQQAFLKAGNFFISLLIKIIPVFILVFILMLLINAFVTKKFILKHLKEKSKIRQWTFAVIIGILSMGPIYMWYPLLESVKEKGVSYGPIACFLYNRAIKLPLLPVIIFYFGFKYVIILTILMIIFSILQGIIIDKLFSKNN